MNVFQWLRLGSKLKKVEKEVEMGGSKAFFNSKTVAGILIAFTPGINSVLARYGYQIMDPAGTWPLLLELFGSALALWGRAVAKVPLALTTPKPDAPPAK